MDHPAFVEQAEPEAVFTLLADDNRVDMLRTLWNADGKMSFSDLHDAVDIKDSGQFNYHLDKLVGQFVTKTDDGYELTVAGEQINGAIEAGSYTTSGTMEPIALDQPCQTCGGNRTFTYENERASLVCDSCDIKAAFPLPPSTFIDCERSEIPTRAARYLRAIIEHLDKGLCSQCDGPVQRKVCRLVDSANWDPTSEFSSDVMGDAHDRPIVQYECLQCGLEPQSGLIYSLLRHPEVVGFYYDRGIDVRDRSLWDFTTLGPEYERVVNTDPFRASTTFYEAGDELTVVVDEDLIVVDTELTEDGN